MFLCRSDVFLGAGILLLSVFASCEEAGPSAISGRYYSGEFLRIPYFIDVVGDSTDYQAEIDSILREVAQACDLNDPASILSRFNRFERTDSAFVFFDSTAMFGAIYGLGSDFHHRTGGIYDPTLNPIRDAWRERKEKGWEKGEPDLDALFKYTLFDGAKIDLNERTSEDGYSYTGSEMRKADPRIVLDFTKLAGAYAMDRLAGFLEVKGITQWRLTYGKSTIIRGAWADSLNVVSLGITGDTTDQRIRLQSGAFSYQTIADKASMIDPSYGYPPNSSELVYVGVVAPSLAEAAVYSEAFMIMGLQDATKWYEENTETRIESFMLIQRGDEITSASTVGFDQLIIVPDSVQITAAQ